MENLLDTTSTWTSDLRCITIDSKHELGDHITGRGDDPVKISILRPIPVADSIRESLLAVQESSDSATFLVVSLTTSLLRARPSADIVRYTGTKR
jgi:hypothetical protein